MDTTNKYSVAASSACIAPTASASNTSTTCLASGQKNGTFSSRVRKYSHLTQQQHLARGLHGRQSNNLTLMNYLSTRTWASYTNVDVAQVARNHPPFMQRLDFMKRLPVHEGCVNTICWNKTGEYILSGSDDCNLCITKPSDMFDSCEHYTVLHKVQTHHLGNIFCAQFIPNSADMRLVSCSTEGPIIVHDINSTDPSDGLLNFNCHSETIYEVVTLPDDDKVFLSCGEDKTIRLFDMRVHSSCARAGTCPHPALIRNSHAMTTLKLHPINPNLMLVGRADGLGLVYDRRKLPDVTKFTRERAHAERLAGLPSQSYQFKHPLEGVVSQFSVPEMNEKYRFTSLCYNKNGSEVLASYSGDYLYLFDHDKSSNFELVQTLKAKQAGKQPSSNGNSDDYSDTSRHRTTRLSNDSRPGDNGAVNDQARPSRSPRSARISRIRVRGDWSDTGVNSVPLSARSRNDNDASREPPRRTSFLEQVAVTLGTQRARERQRFVPAEIVAGPIDWGASSASDASDRRQEQTIEEEEEDTDYHEDDEVDDDNDEDDNSTLIDDEERAGSGEDNINEEFQNYAEITVRNLVEDANQISQRIMRNDESTMMDLDSSCDEELSSDKRRSKDDSDVGESSGRRKISSRIKAKFKRTSEELKNRYNSIPSFKPRVKYQGHRNSRTSIKEAIFWGDNYIMSGSDCGRIMVWEKDTAKIVMGFQADERVVNCLAPNPSTYVLASSGIDYDIKLWSTQGLKEGPLNVSENEMKRIVENNELMLEESKYTLSVPPHLFFRVLASLVHSSR